MKRLVYLNFAALLLIILLVTACSKSNSPIIIKEPNTLNFLALGDSYTIGEGIESEESWPNQLTNKLIENEYNFNSPKIIAKTGWTTNQLLKAIEEEENVEKYNLVSLSIGVNNQFQSKPFEDFKSEFGELLQTALELSDNSNNVFIVSIPDYGVTPFGENNSETIAEDLDMYNAYMLSVCFMFDIPFIDITEISRQLGDDSNALAEDQLHPSAYQYSLWVDEILPFALSLLVE